MSGDVMPATDAASPGAIYDIGYQHYTGKRLGRAGAVRALYVQGLRSIFAIGRGGKAKVPPIALVVIMVVPALIQAALAGLVGGQVQVFTHQGYFRTTVWIFGLFCAFQTPELVSVDQQYRVLALYFSRSLLRSDYVLARLGALVTALFVVALLPHLLLLIGTWFASENVATSMHDTLPLLPRIVAASLAIAVLLSTASLTVAALIRRRPFATAAILAFFLLASAFVTPLVMNRPDKMRYLVMTSPMIVADGVTTAIFDTTTARPAADTAAPRPLTVDTASSAAAVSADSARSRDDRNRRRFRRRRTSVLAAANFPGSAYTGMMMAFLVVSAGVLTLRYRGIDT
jgi:ABC-2 type transport system permease protein